MAAPAATRDALPRPPSLASEDAGGRATPTFRRLCIALFALLFLSYAYVHQHRMWNQHSRLDVLHAIVVHDTVSIDAYHENTGDKAFFDGHYYSDKAPGITFLAFPAFAVAVAVLVAANVHLDSPDGWHFSDWVATAGSVGWLTALGAIATFALLRRYVRLEHALLTTVVLFLGTGMFTWATTLFSHAAVGALLAIALWAVLTPSRASPGPTRQTGRLAAVERALTSRETVAGLACGLAVASEFPAAIPVAGLLAFVGWQRFSRAVHVAIAAAPTASLIPLNNWISFGSPFTFGYSAQTVFPQMREGFFGIGPPTLDGLYTLLVSPARGLFFWSPFLLLGFVGCVRLVRTSPPLFLLFMGVPVVYTVAMSGYYGPDGGSALGPRFLVLLTPFLAVPVALGFEQLRFVGSVLAALSLLFMGGGTLITAQPRQDVTQLLNEFYIPELRAQHFVPNLGSVAGLDGAWSLVPLLAVLAVGIELLWRYARSAPGDSAAAAGAAAGRSRVSLRTSVPAREPGHHRKRRRRGRDAERLERDPAS